MENMKMTLPTYKELINNSEAARESNSKIENSDYVRDYGYSNGFTEDYFVNFMYFIKIHPGCKPH